MQATIQPTTRDVLPMNFAPAPAARRARGFTLIEILCMVVVLGIASAVILPQIGTRDDMKAASAARALMADLLYAQNRSIALQKMHYVRFNTASGTYDVLDLMSPANIITHPVEQAPYTVTLAPSALKGTALQTVSFDGQTVLAFDALGVPYSYNTTTSTAATLNAGSVVVKAGTYTMTVTVMPYSGEVKVN